MILLLAPGASARDEKNPTTCPATSQSREWSATCFNITESGRRIKQQYRNKVVYDRKGYAAIVIAAPPELIVVNRRGIVVDLEIAHLRTPAFDFEAGDAPGDIARFGRFVGHRGHAKKFKCGYYRTGHFQVLVPPVYDQCDGFNDGTGLVCIGCISHCESGDCHESDFVGGEGLLINEKNEILKRFLLPTKPLCSAKESKNGSNKNCRPRPHDPFSEL